MATVADKVLEQLVEQGVLTPARADEAKKAVTKDKGLKEVLIEGSFVDEEAYAQAQAEMLKLAYVDLKGYTIPREVLKIIPEQTAREHNLIAFQETDVELKVAMTEPGDRQIVEFVQKKVNKQVNIHIASSASLALALAQYRESLDLEIQGVLNEVGALTTGEGEDLDKMAEEIPVVRITELVLRHAILRGASDIHIEPSEKSVTIRFRVDGILHDMVTLDRSFLAGLVARIKVLARLKIDEHRLPQDGRFKIEDEDFKVAFRVSILPVFDGEKVVMRLLDESGRGLELAALGMREQLLEVFQRNIHKPHGMILVTGPTGSGKTTTLYASMIELNTPEVNISTIEDPIEYRMQRINQTQVNAKIGLTFANGLRSLVRQDPDILMVGEIRDEETASLAVNAALTGHLVLSTLHTNSAAGALPRLLDMDVEAFLVASTVNVLLAQRLVRKLCEECRQKSSLDAAVVKDLASVVDTERVTALLQEQKLLPKGKELRQATVYEPGGCSVCSDGYKGRMGLYEVIEFTDEIRELITPTTTSQQLADAAREQQGMVSMAEDGVLKAVAGVTTIAEVLRVAKE